MSHKMGRSLRHPTGLCGVREGPQSWHRCTAMNILLITSCRHKLKSQTVEERQWAGGIGNDLRCCQEKWESFWAVPWWQKGQLKYKCSRLQLNACCGLFTFLHKFPSILGKAYCTFPVNHMLTSLLAAFGAQQPLCNQRQFRLPINAHVHFSRSYLQLTLV